jgi:hypothetical protein
VAKKDFRDTLSKKGSLRPGDRSGNNLPQNKRFEYEYIIIPLILILGIAYSYYRITKSLEFSPIQLFEKAFVEPVGSVQDLQGDSKSMVGYDSWLRFTSTNDVTLRNAKDFKSYISEVGRSWFAEKYPGDKALQQPVSDYQYMLRTKDTIGNIVNEGLLINKKTHNYYYRTWGI